MKFSCMKTKEKKMKKNKLTQKAILKIIKNDFMHAMAATV